MSSSHSQEYKYKSSPYAYGYYDNRVTSQLSEAEHCGIAQGSIPIERLGTDSKGDLWVRTFLINTRPNKRGWRVNPDTVEKNVLSIIGKPLVLDTDPVTGRIDHPRWSSLKPAQANIANQERYAVGRYERVFYNPADDSFYGEARITHPRARDFINSRTMKQIQVPVSPQLTWAEDSVNTKDYYTNWDFTHVAIVDEAAYGPQAKVLKTCNGDGEKCRQELQATAVASVPTLVDRPGCYGGMVQAPTNGKRRGCLA